MDQDPGGPSRALAERTRVFLDRLPLARDGGRQLRRLPEGGVVGDWFGCELSSVFQPIVIPGTGAITGYEAYLRILGSGERSLSPWTLFSANADDDRLIALDRLARTAHALNFVTSVDRDSLLFLNVHGRLLAAVSGDHGAAFRKVVDALGLAPERIVIETPLAASSQPELLAFVLRNYRNNGFRVAVNVESPAQWQHIASSAWPQYVKIDRRKLGPPEEARERIEWLNALRNDSTLIVTHMEDAADIGLSEHILLQGYAFGHPTPAPADSAA